MAKAAVQARGGRAAPPGSKAAGKAAAGAKPRKRGTKLWAKIVALVILFPFAAVLLPTTLVFSVMMAPTWVAYITDRSRDKHLGITVGMLNRSEEHTSELQSLMRISYAVFCLKTKNTHNTDPLTS